MREFILVLVDDADQAVKLNQGFEMTNTDQHAQLAIAQGRLAVGIRHKDMRPNKVEDRRSTKDDLWFRVVIQPILATGSAVVEADLTAVADPQTEPSVEQRINAPESQSVQPKKSGIAGWINKLRKK